MRRLEPGILELVMGEEGGKLSTATERLHKELAEIWLDIDRDPDTRVAISATLWGVDQLHRLPRVYGVARGTARSVRRIGRWHR